MGSERSDGVQRNVTATEDRWLRDAAKRGAKVIAPGKLKDATDGVQDVCEWREEDPWGPEPQTYDSACGEKWSFTEGGAKENGIRFCHHCGKPVKIIPFPVAADEDDSADGAGVPERVTSPSSNSNGGVER